MEHQDISPAILYWGTPVVLISSSNPDGSTNIGPMSSAFWLGRGCVLGLDASSQTTQNILRSKQCVLNLASDDMADAVNALARTTGTDPVPEGKRPRGYRFVRDKFGAAGLTPRPSRDVACPGIKECPVIMEAELVTSHRIFGGRPAEGLILTVEVRVLRVSVHENLRMPGHRNRIDADRWKPMIMMFCDLYGLKQGKIEHSKLADIEEEMYRPLSDLSGKVKDVDDDVVEDDAAEHVFGLVASNNQ